MGAAGSKNCDIAIVGLDAAGKTSVTNVMKDGASENTEPTMGFNTETLQAGKRTLKIFDMAGQRTSRELWSVYLGPVQMVIFVIDASDRMRLSEVCEELQSVFQCVKTGEEETADKNKGRPIKKPILILLNKSDIPGAMDADEFCTMKETVAIHQEFNHFVIRVFETMASPAKGEPRGITEAKDWMVQFAGDQKKIAKAKNDLKEYAPRSTLKECTLYRISATERNQ